MVRATLVNGAPDYTHVDHLGSPVAMSDASGTVLWREHYTPFGEKLINPAANKDNTGYTGHIDDAASGLTPLPWPSSSEIDSLDRFLVPSPNRLRSMQARYYDPKIGRFLSNDPVGFVTPDGLNPRMFNRYAYTFNDPINLIDPDGECPKRKRKKASKACPAGGAAGAKMTPIPHPGAKAAGTAIGCGVAAAAACLIPDRLDRRVSRTISRIHDIIEDHVTSDDLKGAKIELEGGTTKLRDDGVPFDHVNEIREARRGLVNGKREINRLLRNPDLTNKQKRGLRNARKRADSAIRRIDKILPKDER